MIGRLVSSLKARRWKEDFQPSILGILINPVFIIRRALYRAVLNHAPKLTGRVLDFGAGSAPYRDLFVNAGDYVTLDIEASGHEDQKIADHYYDGAVIPFPDGSFDGVFAGEVFEHIFNLPDILKELHRVLKPNGLMLLTVPFVWEEHEVPYDFARYTSYGLAHILKEAGFDVEVIEKSTGYLETICQLLTAYMLGIPLLRIKPVKALAMLCVIAPINLIGVALGALLPKSGNLYLNLIVLCRKRQ